MDSLWDTETQEEHGGQTWRSCSTFVADFSVTTNALGAPAKAIQAAHDALDDIHHYPAADNGATLQALSHFTNWPVSNLLVGNGASEFIDLIFRVLPAGPFRPGPFRAAYMEYNRAAKVNARQILHPQDEQHPAVTVIIHPNSPTGDFLTLEQCTHIVQSTEGCVVFDESFMPFYGSDWREHSALNLIDRFPERVLVLASWTKLWACPGIRVGSLAASDVWIKRFKKAQVPWSVNIPAQMFTVAACHDREYMLQTWTQLPAWKKLTEQKVQRLGWKVNHKSPAWVPWVFVDCETETVATNATRVAQSAGCPVRNCASFGQPACIRIGVRRPQFQDVLFKAWVQHFGELQ